MIPPEAPSPPSEKCLAENPTKGFLRNVTDIYRPRSGSLFIFSIRLGRGFSNRKSSHSRHARFVGKLAGTGFDPIGDQVGRVYDVISIIRVTGAPQVVG